ncbi:MAG: toxin-activating lysine-acyltransferase [Candidatus Muproteobacteria bacterium RBG_16_62_13]|uniref:RTX toxin-activating lysine-acyltransferase n=1 Tax=Candidatus Muproteobacteria bacterium RBG_16_62_13 TaxID=1817756 RepID=A0A1F6T845_9PROT|nr:MAG: toxin-activating lysine-acyltransferase [Candidatus Muproteobacteria bacterium RBG_16_62_13]
MESKMSKDNKASPEATDGVVDLKANAAELAKLELEQARAGLAKLPILGPALWLYARDATRKYIFLGDVDWLVLPPVILDQCRLYTKNGIPFAFFTWAAVSDSVDARLRSGIPKIAPHEWKSGPHVWLIDMVAPFGQADEMLAELLRNVLRGKAVRALLPDPQQGGKLAVREWPAAAPTEPVRQ